MRSWWNRDHKRQALDTVNENIPKHIAIIMDGNGRWAKRFGLPRVVGHRNGMKAIKRAAMAANDLGVQYLTLYAFSTENWTRPQQEIDFLMDLPQQFLELELEELIEKNVQIRMIGSEQHMPAHTLRAIHEALQLTKQNTGLVLNFAMNYGSRQELIHCIKSIARDVVSGKLNEEHISSDTISARLYTENIPDPDLLIRTSGELRLSNFMLWQLAYSELWFTDRYWPEFQKEHLYEAVAEYQRRTRRYGGL